MVNDSLKYIKANVQIGFGLRSLTEDVVLKKYFVESSIISDNKKLKKRVNDSLDNESKKVNKICFIKSQPKLKLIKNENCVYIFFSIMCNNKVYTEVIPGPPSIVLKQSGFDIYGKVETFLFEFDRKRIVNVYKGSVDVN